MHICIYRYENVYRNTCTYIHTNKNIYMYHLYIHTYVYIPACNFFERFRASVYISSDATSGALPFSNNHGNERY